MISRMLAELFKTEERVKILCYVMFRNSFSVSEVSKAAGVNKGFVSRYLRLLEDLRLLQRTDRKYSLLEGAFSRSARLILNLEKLARLQRDLGQRTGAEVNLLVMTPQKQAEIKLFDPPFYNSPIINSLTLEGEPLEDSG